MSTLVWIRNDLRLLDNPALHEAARLGAVLPVFIWDPDQKRVPGSASRAWLHHSLEKLEVSMGGLILRRGDSQKELMKLIEQTGVERVFWNRRYTPQGILTDTKIKKALKEAGKEVQSFAGNLLFEPWTIANKQGKPYQVFTPFWKGCLAGEPPEKPLPKPKRMTYVEGVSSLKLKDLDLLPKIHWDKGFWDVWEPGEEAALKKMRRFAEGPVEDYEEERNFPAHEGTSRLSPHLHFGEISARTIWSEIKEARCFLSEIGWREFAYHLLYHFPMTTEKPLQEKFLNFAWRRSPKDLEAWQKGLTGYPIVDAGMRELWHTGWMHNRVRMIVGSFLVKDLLISWREGEAWFWETLVDADLASNTLGWQWVGGCGADAAPYFRVFNPTTQGEKFDPEGTYVRKWVPELKGVPLKYLHKPWEWEGDLDYPRPIVDHAAARDRALEKFNEIK